MLRAVYAHNDVLASFFACAAQLAFSTRGASVLEARASVSYGNTVAGKRQNEKEGNGTAEILLRMSS